MRRLKWLWINLPNLPTMLAFWILKRSMVSDPQFADSWQSNIAMAIYDESRKRCTCRGQTYLGVMPTYFHALTCPQMSGPLSPRFCNDAAWRFMKTCFGVEQNHTQLQQSVNL